MFKLEYRFIEYKPDFSTKEKREVEHNEAYLLLYDMLKKHFDIEYPIVLRTSNGKPYIENDGVFFNLSHTDGLVCCVVADTPCGVDCEKIIDKSNLMGLAKRYFVGNEIEVMKSSNYSNETFFKIWTCKEAVGKRIGCGFILAHKIDSTKENCNTIIENGYIISVNV